MNHKANFWFRISAMIIMGILVAYNQRVDAVLIGLLALLATMKY